MNWRVDRRFWCPAVRTSQQVEPVFLSKKIGDMNKQFPNMRHSTQKVEPVFRKKIEDENK